MSHSTTPTSKPVRHGLGARAQAPSAVPASVSREKLRARAYAQLMQLLSQMAVR